MARMTSHFLAIAEESYDRSAIYGIFDTFDAARDELERLTASTNKDRDGAYGADRATIQEWDAGKRVTEWERDWSSPLSWVDTRA